MAGRKVLTVLIVVLVVIALVSMAWESNAMWLRIVALCAVIASVSLIVIAILLARVLGQIAQLIAASKQLTSAFHQFRGSIGEVIRFQNEAIRDVRNQTEDRVAESFLGSDSSTFPGSSPGDRG